MGEADTLLVVLAVVYLTECVVWIPKGSAILVKAWRRDFVARHPGTLPGNPRGSLYVAPIFPPLGTVLLVPEPSFCASPQAIVAWPPSCLDPGGRPTVSGIRVDWADIRSIRAKGKSIRINDRPFTNTITTDHACWMAARLREFWKAQAEERGGMIERFLGEMLNAEAAETRWKMFNESQAGLRVAANLLFCYLFALCPPLVFLYGLKHMAIPLAAGLLVQSIAIAFRFRRRHRRLNPEAEDDRFKYFLTMLLAPPSAIRAVDALGKHALATFHILAVSRVVQAGTTFRATFRRALIDWRYPLLPAYPNAVPETVACVDWFRERMGRAIRRLAEDSGLNPHELLAPIPPGDPGIAAYCPRCQAQFLTAESRCEDCGGRELERWPQTN